MKDKYAVQKIRYTKESGETSEREVICIGKPSSNFMMIEVTGTDASTIQNTLRRHKEELDALKPNWKAFNPNGVEFLDANSN
jgi:hypothetical protein